MAANATTTSDTTAAVRSLESKMASMMGIVDTLSRKVEETNNLFMTADSAYFLNMAETLGSTMHEAEMDRRLYEEAMEQNARAREMTSGSPERGDANFWKQAFAPTPLSPAEVQASALKSTFSDASVIDAFKGMMSSGKNNDSDGLKDIIRDAVRGKADDRTLGEKFLDKAGLGQIVKIKDWFADRDIRREEKATAKDQGLIKREQKQMDRLAAKYRRMKASGATDEELAEIQEQFQGHQLSQNSAAARIRERNNDDLFEMGKPGSESGLPGSNNALSKDSSKKIADELLASLINSASNNKPGANPDGKAGTGLVGGPDLSKAIEENTSAIKDMSDMVSDSSDKISVAADSVDSIETKLNRTLTNRYFDSGIETNRQISAYIGDGRESHDIQRNLDTRLRPDFYKEGTTFFKKAINGELVVGADLESEGLLGGGISSFGKAGVVAAAATAAAASAAKIGQAAGLVKDWYDASSSAVENVKEMTERNNAELEKRKNGVNDDMLAATQASNKADQELHESQESWTDSAGSFIKDSLFGGLFGKSDRKKAEEAAAAAEQKRKEELQKYGEFREAAKKAGVNLTDAAAMKKFNDLYDKGQAEQYKPSGNGKLAAGNMQESDQGTNMQTPGSKSEPEKAETAEEQRKRIEEATFEGTKRALLDAEVQKKNEENAKIQGQQIDQSLNGRK